MSAVLWVAFALALVMLFVLAASFGSQGNAEMEKAWYAGGTIVGSVLAVVVIIARFV